MQVSASVAEMQVSASVAEPAPKSAVPSPTVSSSSAADRPKRDGAGKNKHRPTGEGSPN